MSVPHAPPGGTASQGAARSLPATAALFAALGVAAGAWAAHVPSVKARYGLDEVRLSWLLLAAAIGAVLALFVAGRLVARLGVRRCVQGAGLGLALGLAGVLQLPALVEGAAMAATSLPIPSSAPSASSASSALVGLVALMLLLGASMSVFDVAINAEGTALEALTGRKVMGRLHALFSVGGMAGASLASAMFAAGVQAPMQLVALALITAAGSWLAAPWLLHEHPPEHAPVSGQRLTALRGVVWLLGLLTLAAMVAEGAMYDWCVLFLTQERRQAPATAALGFAVFSAAMALARWLADAARARWPEDRLLRAGAALAAVALTAVLLSSHPAVAFVGYALTGMGLAPAVPILYTAATRIAGVPRASALAAVSSIGYAGFMIGPPLIGALARATSLTAALGVVVVAAAALAVFARRIP